MNQATTSLGNGNHRPAVDVLEDNQQSGTTFHDPSNPLLAPPKEIDKTKQKGRKRRLITVCFVFVVIAGSAFFLYRASRVKRVNVTVQADARRDAQGTRSKGDSKNSENDASTEAVNLARKALGADNATTGNANNASPTPTPSPSLERTNGSIPEVLPSLAGTYTAGGTDNGSTNQQIGFQPRPSGPSDQRINETTSTNQEVSQSRANITQTLFVDDAPLKLDRKPTSGTAQTQTKTNITPAINITPAVLPPFGTMLPVRTQGVIFTLRNNSYARFELTGDVGGKGWSLPKGTVLVGRTTGSEYDRAFVNVIGYIDPRENKLIKMSGDVLGSDGAAGLPGKRIGVDRNRLKQTLRKVASTGMQVAGTVGGVLGRGTVILDRSGYSIPDDIRGSNSQDPKNAFVKVAAGQAAYVMVADLPKSIQAIDAPGDDELARAGASLTDREVMELFLFGSPDEIRAAMQLMNDEQKRLAAKALAQENEEK